MILHKNIPLAEMEKHDLQLLIEDIKSYADQKHRKLKAAGYPHAEIELSLPVADKSMQTRLNVKITHANPKSAKIDVQLLTWKANGHIESYFIFPIRKSVHQNNFVIGRKGTGMVRLYIKPIIKIQN